MEHAKLILIFHAVITHGSMNKAGLVLGMSASAISQHIRNLEKFYKIKLLNRNTRTLTPTDAGRKLWTYAQNLHRVIAECNSAMADMHQTPQGDVAISLPSGYAGLPQIQNAIRSIRLHYPKIRLILKSSDDMADLWQDKIDIAIRTGLPDDLSDDMIARELASWQITVCANRHYLEQHPIVSKTDLLSAHWLNFNAHILKSVLAALDLPSDLPQERTDCTVSDARILVQAGLGVAVFLSGESTPLIQSGKLVEILPALPKPGRTLYAITAGRSDVFKVAAVIEEIKKAFAS
ncbi:LysR family transcriptional regulator [Neisseria chenwenguii]|uniref:LysR family transcriptional regulator n=1 Tax=Neisseria chenwenguii TaxID=1853278 RepID=UPI000F4FB360|nr:LysR family transcriptional regulator [Neisseria chenwenguii]ROV54424.1 LysR family transcriptional regulator [Neisseria chenwenguii]